MPGVTLMYRNHSQQLICNLVSNEVTEVNLKGNWSQQLFPLTTNGKFARSKIVTSTIEINHH